MGICRRIHSQLRGSEKVSSFIMLGWFGEDLALEEEGRCVLRREGGSDGG